jgi:capsular exopolysaccharide synthesis family protein
MAEPNEKQSKPAPGRDGKGLVPVSSNGHTPVNLTTAVRGAPPPGGGFSLSLVRDALRHWGKIVVPAGLILGALAGGLAYLLWTPMYEASAWIRIEESPQVVAFDLKQDSKAAVQTETELIKSPMVVTAALADMAKASKPVPEIQEQADMAKASKPVPEIQEQADPVNWLVKRLAIKRRGQSELYELAFASPNPNDAARVVNAVVIAYLSLRESQERQRGLKVIQILDQEKKDRESKQLASRENLRKLGIQLSGRDPFPDKSQRDAVARNPASELEARLVREEVEEVVLKARIKALEEVAGTAKTGASEKSADTDRTGLAVGSAIARSVTPVPTLLESYRKAPWDLGAYSAEGVESRIDAHPEIQRLKSLILVNEAKIQEIASKSTEGMNHPSCKGLREQIARDERTVETLRAKVREDISAQMRVQRREKLGEELAAMHLDLQSRRSAIAEWRKRHKDELAKQEKDTGESFELLFQKAELDRADRVLDRVSQRLLELKTEQGAPSRVRVEAAAKAPLAPVEVFPFKTVIPASLLGLCLPLLLATLWEHFAQRLSDPASLERQCNLRIVAEIARFPESSRRHRGLGGKNGQRGLTMFQESVDTLRTRLLLGDQSVSTRVLAVTSAVNDEGKTSLAVQLAVSIAQSSGEPTLLIDGDVRSSDVHRVFDIPLEPGLSSVLRGETGLEEAIAAVWKGRLHVLPAGRLRGSPHRLITNDSWAALLEQIPATYSHVVIDTPPVLAASEALVFARNADATILCARRDVSRTLQVRKAFEHLVTTGAHVVAAAFNGVSLREYAHRYGSYPYPESPAK